MLRPSGRSNSKRRRRLASFARSKVQYNLIITYVRVLNLLVNALQRTLLCFQEREREIELDAEFQKLEADRAVAAAEEARAARTRREEAERNRQQALLDQIESVGYLC